MTRVVKRFTSHLKNTMTRTPVKQDIVLITTYIVNF